MTNPPTFNQSKLNTRQLALVGLMTSILCAMGPLSFTIPISPIPLSLGTLAIYFVSIVLGAKSGTVSVVLYILLGFAGLPVFTGFMGGPAKVFGPTGGYIWGYIFLALICGFSAEKLNRQPLLSFMGMLFGTAVCYLFGTFWLSFQLSLSFLEALTLGVLPYLPGDLIKLLLATVMGNKLRRHLLRANLLH